MMRKIPWKRRWPVYGTMHVRKVIAMGTQVKALSSKLIIKILKAQETMFKYGHLFREMIVMQKILPRHRDGDRAGHWHG